VDLLRQNHIKHYDFATWFNTLVKISTADKFAWSIFEIAPPKRFQITV